MQVLAPTAAFVLTVVRLKRLFLHKVLSNNKKIPPVGGIFFVFTM